MPKEYIASGHPVPDGVPQTWASVGWSREVGHVQLATLATEGAVFEPTPEGNGWFVSLDRAGINRLIRTLRKARDQAFGADA